MKEKLIFIVIISLISWINIFALGKKEKPNLPDYATPVFAAENRIVDYVWLDKERIVYSTIIDIKEGREGRFGIYNISTKETHYIETPTKIRGKNYTFVEAINKNSDNHLCLSIEYIKNTLQNSEYFYYLYDLTTLSWTKIDIPDEIFTYIFLNKKEILFWLFEDNFAIYNIEKQLITDRFKIIDKNIGTKFYSYLADKSSIILEDLMNYTKEKIDFLVYDIKNKKYKVYPFQTQPLYDLIHIDKLEFYAVEEYSSGYPNEKNHVVKINLETGQKEIVAMEGFNREILKFKKVEDGLYSFVIDTGYHSGFASGRVWGNHILCTIELPLK